jgi:N-acyl-D-aspartate/D-glutamate deacylase
MTALADPEQRRRLAEGAASATSTTVRLVLNFEEMTVVDTVAPEHEGLAGRTVGAIARERGHTPLDCLLDIVVADELRTLLKLPFPGDDPETWQLRRALLTDHRVVIGGSDAGAHLDQLCAFTYPTSLLRSVRDRDVVPLELAIHLMTDVPARFYGLRDRGRIAPGYRADLVLFDPERVEPDRVSWRNDLPTGAGRLFCGAKGIAHVLVNGVETVRDSQLTGATPGVVLRSGRDTKTVGVGFAADTSQRHNWR